MNLDVRLRLGGGGKKYWHRRPSRHNTFNQANNIPVTKFYKIWGKSVKGFGQTTKQTIRQWLLRLYINILCLSSVRLFVSNKRQKKKNFVGPPVTRRKVYSLKNLLLKNSVFKRFWKSAKFYLWNLRFFGGFVLQSKQREHVHNSNRRWTRSALKA